MAGSIDHLKGNERQRPRTACRMVHHANHLGPRSDGEMKVVGHCLVTQARAIVATDDRLSPGRPAQLRAARIGDKCRM